ncbi:hypothetical protein [Leifsonia sp. Leaf264]|uniref:hypothetical protein n=1 Tax=Leifsonia sp. Leaf264 TaxID=1736314 RepID=UPI0006F74631|nr:hypothetical protein [Leifsonia sp. Leaf264]KQO98167.1 hypothetical protein ASF30_08895 [Leifsonia sp. Leaf264]
MTDITNPEFEQTVNRTGDGTFGMKPDPEAFEGQIVPPGVCVDCSAAQGEAHLGGRCTECAEEYECDDCGTHTDKDDIQGGICSDCRAMNTCSEEDCDNSLEDNEGYDGLCGDHADIDYSHMACQRCGAEKRNRSDNYCASCGDEVFDGLGDGDVLIISHAEGDFDAEEFGVEGFEVQKSGAGYAAIAYNYADFGHLAPRLGMTFDEIYDWLDENKDAVIDALGQVAPGWVTSSDNDEKTVDWESGRLTHPINWEGDFPEDGEGFIATMAGSGHRAKFLLDNIGGDGFWDKLAGKLKPAVAA